MVSKERGLHILCKMSPWEQLLGGRRCLPREQRCREPGRSEVYTVGVDKNRLIHTLFHGQSGLLMHVNNTRVYVYVLSIR